MYSGIHADVRVTCDLSAFDYDLVCTIARMLVCTIVIWQHVETEAWRATVGFKSQL